MTHPARHINAYRQTEVQSRTPLELVIMMYDGGLRFLGEGIAAAERNDVRTRVHAVSRAMDILCELQNTLNVKDGGEVAERLDALYGYMITRLLDSTTKRDKNAIKEVHQLLLTIREGWAGIATQDAPAPARTAR